MLRCHGATVFGSALAAREIAALAASLLLLLLVAWHPRYSVLLCAARQLDVGRARALSSGAGALGLRLRME